MAKEYIEREVALAKRMAAGLCDASGNVYGCAEFVLTDDIEALPAADVAPVVRGRWIEWWPGDCALILTGEEMLWCCSCCDAKYCSQHKDCPNCGAKMEDYNEP